MVEKLKEKSIDFVGTVYHDPLVSEAGFEGSALGDSTAKEAVRKIARRLLDLTNP